MTKVFDPFRGAELTMKNPGRRAVLRFGLVLFCAWAAARGQLDLLPELSLDDLESGEESAAETAPPVEEEKKIKEEADVVTDSVGDEYNPVMMRAGVDPEDEVIRGVADTLFDILPIEACFFLSDPVDLGKPETQLGEWPVIAEFLLARQNDDGSWGEAKRVHNWPSSLRERMETLPVFHYGHSLSASELGRPHVYFNLEEEKQPVIRKDFLCPGRLLRTCYALLALSAESGPEAGPGAPAEDGGP